MKLSTVKKPKREIRDTNSEETTVEDMFSKSLLLSRRVILWPSWYERHMMSPTTVDRTVLRTDHRKTKDIWSVHVFNALRLKMSASFDIYTNPVMVGL